MFSLNCFKKIYTITKQDLTARRRPQVYLNHVIQCRLIPYHLSLQMKRIMTSSFISMEAVDVKLLQERELRDDFSFINKLKYNSIRFINNFKAKNSHKVIKSDFMVSEFDDFENINITTDYEDEHDHDSIFDMEICPEWA